MAQSDNHPDPKTQQGNNNGKNWRQISLLCPAAKNAGKAPAAHNTDTYPFPPCSTWHKATALSTITANIAAGFSRKKPVNRTVLVALDLTAAFDNVDHQQLLDCVFHTNIPAAIRLWLYNYMQNRRTKVHFLKSIKRNQKAER